jgi:haloalkane dehalogenase
MPLDDPEKRKGSWVFPGQIIGSSDWLQSMWDKRDVLKDKNILIAWGMKDIAFRKKEMDRWAGAFPDAKVIRFPNAGHFISEEEPGELISAIRGYFADK